MDASRNWTKEWMRENHFISSLFFTWKKYKYALMKHIQLDCASTKYFGIFFKNFCYFFLFFWGKKIFKVFSTFNSWKKSVPLFKNPRKVCHLIWKYFKLWRREWGSRWDMSQNILFNPAQQELFHYFNYPNILNVNSPLAFHSSG